MFLKISLAFDHEPKAFLKEGGVVVARWEDPTFGRNDISSQSMIVEK